ncbi:hypothetical protein ASG25_05345 [Rhizobium sp. Leaf384]|uniref:hypothetical protein n=1 Tax=unclassified Rhizobium TaxID=2613769 RepID=UPI0007127C6B|nr:MULTISPECIES: hypothetical protein [unclassified Rhizobium]KQR77724.1 hypothetical protein ASG03_15180 [Rhizobium sp. Leaf341]KQS80941.1 hypothetical protein ASG25_05345 [Rhizobium sp. Leaf384]KQS86801.1 hypothetical protein ASG58_00645 [Rhizobium sp. Leaf383]
MEIQASGDVRIRSILGRLEMILDNENARIGVDPTFDLKASNLRKSRCLYELTMLSRKETPADATPSYVSQAKHIRNKLAANSEKVEAHLDACRSVVELLKAAAQDADADGIYSEEQFRYGAM